MMLRRGTRGIMYRCVRHCHGLALQSGAKYDAVIIGGGETYGSCKPLCHNEECAVPGTWAW